MQLENRGSIRQALALATCTVLSGTAQAGDGTPEWQIDSSLLSYSEAGRVSVTEPVLFATHQLGDDESVTFKTVYDSMTGASPNGATPTDQSQTFTGASGAAGYTTPAGETPTRSFADTRVALGLDWSKRTSRLLTRSLGVNFSAEQDYTSFGGSLNFARELNQKLTTLGFGVGVSADLVQPHAGAPVGLQSTSVPTAPPVTTTTASGGEEGEEGGEGIQGKQKTTTDVLVGITQVLSRKTLIQVNYTHSYLYGYLTDPYKVLSVVAPTTGATLDYVYEKRPGTRNADTLYGKLVHHFGQDVVHLAVRYFRDDWGIRSHTSELQYHLKLGRHFYLEPQVRYYTQSAADFYRHSLVQGEQVSYASADFRLGEMVSTTAGLRVGVKLGDGELSVRYARMRQSGNAHPKDAIGIQKNYVLYPTLDATIVNLNYSVAL